MKYLILLSSVFIAACAPTQRFVSEHNIENHFKNIRQDPAALRDFLYRFPKGGDIHNHIDGAVSAMSWIQWSADDGKCIDLGDYTVLLPPCDSAVGKPKLASLLGDSAQVDKIIDAFSMRNFQGSTEAAAEHFFSTFLKFHNSAGGREGDMLTEVTSNAAAQNVFYLELMQSWNMSSARAFAKAGSEEISDEQNRPNMQQITNHTIALLDQVDQGRRELQGCDSPSPQLGCKVEVRYVAQILRSFPRDQVRAQTQHAVQLMERDPRVVGLNFVAPEHHPTSLKDYAWQMKMIAEETAHLPERSRNIALHAGELTPSMVAAEHLGFHVDDAVHVAGAKRIGHAVELEYYATPETLLTHMAEQGVAIEINISSNDYILGVSGADHPFNLFRRYGVPLTLSTDDEAISLSDLTQEYQRAVESYDLNYSDIKLLARNALEYSFLAGESLFLNKRYGQYVRACEHQRTKTLLTEACQDYLQDNNKAQQQWLFEKRLTNFEQQFY